MRLAAIADIHGNLHALDAVLADVARRGVDLVVNLGDCLSGLLLPVETADRLMPLRLPTISGNHERQLLTLDRDRMGPADRFTAEMLGPEQWAWLRTLPPTLRVGDDVLLVHGTPESDLAYFVETVTEAGIRAATTAEVAARAGEVDAALILCGHTHVPRAVRLEDGRLVVNPGSVGLQAFEDATPFPHRVEGETPHARYAILERVRGRWEAELVAVEYDREGAAACAERHGRADWGRVLRTGRL